MNKVKRNIQGYPVLIIGAGRGGVALLEMFSHDSLVEVLAIADSNPSAPGIILAKSLGIPSFATAHEALTACKDYPDCIVYNLSHDEAVTQQAMEIFGPGKRVASGPEVNLFWQMVTNLKQVKSELEKSQNQLQAIIQNALDGIITTDESGNILGLNPVAEQIFGYSMQDISGQNLTRLLPESGQSGQGSYIDRYIQSTEATKAGARGREVIAIRKNGEEFPIELSASEMQLGGQRYFIGIVRDITERKQAEDKIEHLAHYDFLTNLPNRAFFLDNLNHCVAIAKRNSNKMAVLFLDLDGFKKINDTLGHDIGDLLLRETAMRLKANIRESDTVSRVGGDEFILLLNDIGSIENAGGMADKIIASLSVPYDLRGQRCNIGGSIGIAVFPNDSTAPETLIKYADNAMYFAKHSGKNTYKYSRDVPAES